MKIIELARPKKIMYARTRSTIGDATKVITGTGVVSKGKIEIRAAIVILKHRNYSQVLIVHTDILLPYTHD